MSLKAFHIVFVVLSVLLSIGFGVWAVGQSHNGGAGFLFAAATAVVVAAALVAYGFWFLRKLKHVSFL